jgi:hypothetical protein
MPITPEEFVKQYLPIAFTTCVSDSETKAIKDGVAEMVHIKTYINAALRPRDKESGKHIEYVEGKGMPDYEIKDMFLSFIRKRSKDKTSGITKVANKYDVVGVTPNISYKEVSFPLAFMGKCTPDELRDTLRLFSYYWEQSKTMKTRFPTLQKFADVCLGLDCNGFTGAYFKTQYPELGIEPSTWIGNYDKKKGKRTSLLELKPRDIIIPFPDYRHIAMIGDIRVQTETEVVCNICQSRSPSLGGVGFSESTIVFDKGKGFRYKSTPGIYFKTIVQIIP